MLKLADEMSKAVSDSEKWQGAHAKTTQEFDRFKTEMFKKVGKLQDENVEVKQRSKGLEAEVEKVSLSTSTWA